MSCACDHSPTTPDIPLNIEASIWFLLHMMAEVCRSLSPKSHKVCISHPDSACSPDNIKIGVKGALLATHVCQDRQCLARHHDRCIRTDSCCIRHKSLDMSTQSRCSCKTKVPTAWHTASAFRLLSNRAFAASHVASSASSPAVDSCTHSHSLNVRRWPLSPLPAVVALYPLRSVKITR